MKFLFSLLGLLLGAAAVFFLISDQFGPDKNVQSALVGNEAKQVNPSTTSIATTPDSGESAAGDPISYTLNDDSLITFTGYKGPIAQVSDFDPPTGSFDMPKGTPVGGTIKAMIETEFSYHEGQSQKYEEVVSKNILESDEYPEATFESTAITKSEDEYTVRGDLTIKDITKTIQFNAKIDHTDESFDLTAEFRLPRKNWNLVYKGTFVPDSLINAEFLMKLALKGDASN